MAWVTTINTGRSDKETTPLADIVIYGHIQLSTALKIPLIEITSKEEIQSSGEIVGLLIHLKITPGDIDLNHQEITNVTKTVR